WDGGGAPALDPSCLSASGGHPRHWPAVVPMYCRPLIPMALDQKPEATMSRKRLKKATPWLISERARSEMSHGVAFFNLFRDMVASGFWSSAMGINGLQYMGTTAGQWRGCPPEALRQLGSSAGAPPPSQ